MIGDTCYVWWSMSIVFTCLMSMLICHVNLLCLKLEIVNQRSSVSVLWCVFPFLVQFVKLRAWLCIIVIQHLLLTFSAVSSNARIQPETLECRSYMFWFNWLILLVLPVWLEGSIWAGNSQNGAWDLSTGQRAALESDMTQFIRNSSSGIFQKHER